MIENLLCFQHYEGPFRHYVDRPAFTLITPGCFALDQDPPKPLSRLYQYLFAGTDIKERQPVLQDIHGFKLEKRNGVAGSIPYRTTYHRKRQEPDLAVGDIR